MSLFVQAPFVNFYCLNSQNAEDLAPVTVCNKARQNGENVRLYRSTSECSATLGSDRVSGLQIGRLCDSLSQRSHKSEIKILKMLSFSSGKFVAIHFRMPTQNLSLGSLDSAKPGEPHAVE